MKPKTENCKEMKNPKMMKAIRINGHVINGALLVDDPEVKRAFEDAAGQPRHVRCFTQPGRLKAYLKKHPEGIILAGVGTFFFTEPVPVACTSVVFDDAGGAEIHIKDAAYNMEKQLAAIDEIYEAAMKEYTGVN